MIIDSHTHIFTNKVIAGGCAQEELTALLQLDAKLAPERTSVAALQRESRAAGVSACLLLPVSPAAEVARTNSTFMKMAAGTDSIYTAGNLHPHCKNIEAELYRLHSREIRIIKLCSYAQRFSPDAPETQAMFKLVAGVAAAVGVRFTVIMDTFYLASDYLGTPAECVTTPARLGKLVRTYPELNFVAAHMGGLGAPQELVDRHLAPAPNLYLDTSVAAHTLSERDFLRLLDLHGPEHVIFGTDWPWLSHATEVRLIDQLLDKANFTPPEKEQVFCRNIAGLLGMQVSGLEGLLPKL